MFQRLALFYNSHIKHHLFPQVEESDEGYKNLHYKKIKLAAMAVQNDALPLDKRVEGVHQIGLLAYTGSYAGATSAAECMAAMVDLLRSTDLSDDQRIVVLGGLVGICYVHLTNQRQVEESDEGYKNLHYKKIKLAAMAVQNDALPLDKRVEGVHQIGLLAYTGSYAGATSAAECMAAMVDLLRSTDLSDDQRIVVLGGLVGICYVHLTNQRQARSLGLFVTLQELMDPAGPLSTTAKLWSCYLLSVLCCNNIPAIRTLTGSESLRHSLEALETEEWFGWPKNHAQELLCILGFWPPQPIKIPGEKDVVNQDDDSQTEF